MQIKLFALQAIVFIMCRQYCVDVDATFNILNHLSAKRFLHKLVNSDEWKILVLNERNDSWSLF